MRYTKFLFILLIIVFAFSCKNPTADIKLKNPNNPSMSEDKSPSGGDAPVGEDITSGNLPDGYTKPDAGDTNGPLSSDSGKNFNERTDGKTFYGREQADEWKFIFSKVSEGKQTVNFIWNKKLHKTYTFEAPEKDNGKAGFNQDVGVYLGFKLSDDGSYIERTKTSYVSLASIDFDNAEYRYKAYLVNTPSADTLFQKAEKNKMYQRKGDDQILHTYYFSDDGATLTYDTTEIINGETQTTVVKAIYTYVSETDDKNAIYTDGTNSVAIKIETTKMYFDTVEVGDTAFSDIESIIITLLKEGGVFRVRPLVGGVTGDTLYEYEVKDKGFTIIYKEIKHPSATPTRLQTYKFKSTDSDYSAIYYELSDTSKTLKFTVNTDGKELTPNTKPTGVKEALDPGYNPPNQFPGKVAGKTFARRVGLTLYQYEFSNDGSTISFKEKVWAGAANLGTTEVKGSYTFVSETSDTEATYGSITLTLTSSDVNLYDGVNYLGVKDFVDPEPTFKERVAGKTFKSSDGTWSFAFNNDGSSVHFWAKRWYGAQNEDYTFDKQNNNVTAGYRKSAGVFYGLRLINNDTEIECTETSGASSDLTWGLVWGWKAKVIGGGYNPPEGEVTEPKFVTDTKGKTFRKRADGYLHIYTFSASGDQVTYVKKASPTSVEDLRETYQYEESTSDTTSKYSGKVFELSGTTLNSDGSYAGKLGYQDTALTFADLTVGGTFKNGGATWAISGTDGYKTIVISGAGGANGNYNFYKANYSGNIKKYIYNSSGYYLFTAIPEGEGVKLTRSSWAGIEGTIIDNNSLEATRQ